MHFLIMLWTGLMKGEKSLPESWSASDD